MMPLAMKKAIPFILIILAALGSGPILGCSSDKPGVSQAVALPEPSDTGDKSPAPVTGGPSPEDKVTVKLSLVGDIMLHVPELNAAYDRATGKYSFDSFFAGVRDYLSSADVTMGNLETTLAGRDKGYSGYPQFNSPHEIVPALKNAGFDVLTTANNHAMDRGEYGVLKTISRLEEAGMKHTGTFSSPEDRNRPLILEVRGVKLGIVACTYGTNGIPLPKGRKYLVNIFNRQQVQSDIKQARLQGADVVMVFPHFGVEYRRVPQQAEKEMVEQLFRAGADIVAGSHPHVIQMMVRRDLVPGAQGLFAAYSLGNFLSAQRGQYKDSGVILNLKLEKELASGKVRIIGAEFVPTWVHKYREKGKILYRVVAVEKAIRDYEQGLDRRYTAQDYARLKQVWQETTSLLSGPNSPELHHI